MLRRAIGLNISSKVLQLEVAVIMIESFDHTA